MGFSEPVETNNQTNNVNGHKKPKHYDPGVLKIQNGRHKIRAINGKLIFYSYSKRV